MRTGSALTFVAQDAGDILLLGDQVAFTDDTSLGAGGTSVFVNGNGTVVYDGTTDYPGTITINNANFKVNGLIDTASVFVCRNSGFSAQRGTLSGIGALSGNIFANSGTISPDGGGQLTLGSLTLNSADPGNTLGSLVHIEIDSNGSSLVYVNGPATLAGTLEIQLDPTVVSGTYTILTSTNISGTFDSVTFTGPTPNYRLTYLATSVEFELLATPPPQPSVVPPLNLKGQKLQNNFGFEYELYNQLTWTRSTSPGIVGYFILRDGTKIATVNNSTFSYQDHNLPRGVSFTYSVVAFNSSGNTSSAVTVTVP